MLVALIESNPTMRFEAMARSESAFPSIRATGATPFKGTFEDHDIIVDKSAQADIVINAADSDHVGLNTAILEGFKRRREEGRGIGSLIHISGGSTFFDGNKNGKFEPTSKVWTVSPLAFPCQVIFSRTYTGP